MTQTPQSAPPLTVPIRPAVETLPRYIPGRARTGAVKLSSNEMPIAPSAQVIEAAVRALASANRYPDLAAVELRTALAARYGLTMEQVCVGTGSSAVLLAALSAVCTPDAEVVYPWRSFESYPIAVPASHATPVSVPLTASWEHDLDALLRAVTDRTAALIVCTPNNPTGPALTFDQVANLARRLPSRVLLIVDEAYMEFATAPGVSTAVPLIAQHSNVLVMRTFSKAYSLAGLRVGYALGHPELIGAIQAVSVPFGVSAVAQAAALAALSDQAGVRSAVDAVVAERERVVSQLRAMGLEVPDTQSNFFFLPGVAKDFFHLCADEGILVRPFPEGIRVSLGTPEENDRFVQLARQLVDAQ